MSKAARRLTFYTAVLALLLLGGAYMKCMPGDSIAKNSLAEAPNAADLARELRGDLWFLAHDIGERRLGFGDTLKRSSEYLVGQLRQVAERERGEVRFEALGESGISRNVIFELPGSGSELVVVGAHYDSAIGTPGANDNASGVAVTLALARRLAQYRFEHTLRFVLFANEEAPYFHTELMGSLVHARGCRARGESVVGMLALESLGYYSDAQGSQKYPGPVGWFYPTRGNFIGFVANLESRSLLREAIASFRETRLLPSEGAALPAGIPGVGWSDHWAFWQHDYPAIMVTDTAVFRDPNYHRPSDRPENIDYSNMARVTLGLERVLEVLARRR
jgi:hypothetical protein